MPRPPMQTRQPPQEKVVSNGAKPAPPDAEFAKLMTEDVRYTMYKPLGEQDEIKLTVPLVLRYLCVPTRSGVYPQEQDAQKYIMICKQRRLNPWAGDCFLLGYDTKNGAKFSVVVALQAILKRAEVSPAFDGMESGVVVERGGEIIERPGDLVFKGESLIGGWAAAYRKDRSKAFYQRLKLETYKRPTPQWDDDAAGMICKCCESAALRQAFPSDIGGLYLEQEIRASEHTGVEPTEQPKQNAAAQLRDRLGQPKEPPKEAIVAPTAPTEAQEPAPPEDSQELPSDEPADDGVQDELHAQGEQEE